MKVLAFAWRGLNRDLRAGELNVLLAAIIVAVTAMTAVGFFTDRVAGAMKAQASEVMAADLVIRSAAPIDPAFPERARRLGLATAESLSFPTVVSSDAQTTLAAVDAVSDGYPLRGRLLVSETLFGESVTAQGIPGRGEAWAEPGLLGRLDFDVGDVLTLGRIELRITRVLQYKPDQNIGFMNLAPGVMINLADIPATGVVRPGSRVTYHQMYAGDERSLAEFRRSLADDLRPDESLRGREDAGEQITAAIDRAERFLALASLVTVILSAVAAAMASRRYVLRHLDNVALMKTLGMTRRFVSAVLLVELVMIIIVTALIGALLGQAAQYGLAVIAAEYVGVVLPAASGRPWTLGLLTAATVVLGFALPYLWRLGAVAPLRVLRKDLPPPHMANSATYGVAVAALLLMVYIIIRDLLLVALIAGGVLVTGLVSAGLGWLLVRVLARFRGAAGVA